MREIDTDAANVSINGIAEAVRSLAQEGHLLVGKREDGGKRLPLDFQKQLDEGYVSNYFARGTFELKLSHQGRKQLDNDGTPPHDDKSQDHKFARLAIEEARKSVSENDGRQHPFVVAVVVKDGELMASTSTGESCGKHP